MGHRWLGELPKTQNWVKVIDLLGVTDDPVEIADATSRAADHGLDLAKKDTGVAKVAHMLMKLVWSARGENFEDELASLGMSLPKEPSLLDVVGTFVNGTRIDSGAEGVVLSHGDVLSLGPSQISTYMFYMVNET